jgi:hypothetical protein
MLVTDSKGFTPWHIFARKHGSASDSDGPIRHALFAVGADMDCTCTDDMVIQFDEPVGQILLADNVVAVEAARRRIARKRLDFVRERALQVCIGLQPRGLDALQMCEILQHACGPMAPLIPFHIWWTIATKVKHFHC